MSDIEGIARDCCVDYICGMSVALAEGLPEKFDLFYDFYTSAFQRVTDKHTRTQMGKLVGKLYERRKENE